MDTSSNIALLQQQITLVNRINPEVDLWVAVLILAIKDAARLARKGSKNPQLWDDPNFRAEAIHLKKYFHNKSMRVGGFGFICELLDINPEQALRNIHARYLRFLPPTTQTCLIQADCQAG
ncbi:MAG: hypothetical protein HQM03_19660 [Magnetococcales bacterium]|nr:hypothetical protein [Magnetococcales bacterium]